MPTIRHASEGEGNGDRSPRHRPIRGWRRLTHPPQPGHAAGGHALVDGDDVWVVDPVDAAGLDDLLAEDGPMAGVVVLFDWHARDAGALAARHGAPVHVPTWVTRVANRIDTPVERFEGERAKTGFRALRIAPHPYWREAVRYRESDRTLVVPESDGTAPYSRAPGERLGVSPYQRLWPPRRSLSNLAPERVLFGHGMGVFDDATDALADALAAARRRAPEVVGRNLPTVLRNLAAAVRD